MNAFSSFDLFIVYIPEWKQQLRTMKYNTHRYEILHTLNHHHHQQPIMEQTYQQHSRQRKYTLWVRSSDLKGLYKLNNSTKTVKTAAYTSMVRPTVENASNLGPS